MFRHPAWLKERLTTPGHGITFPPQILRQIHLHLSCSFEWHRIKVRVELGQEADPVFLHYPGRFVAMLVILETVLNRQSGYPNVDARLRRIAFRIKTQDRAMPQHGRIQ